MKIDDAGVLRLLLALPFVAVGALLSVVGQWVSRVGLSMANLEVPE